MDTACARACAHFMWAVYSRLPRIMVCFFTDMLFVSPSVMVYRLVDYLSVASTAPPRLFRCIPLLHRLLFTTAYAPARMAVYLDAMVRAVICRVGLWACLKPAGSYAGAPPRFLFAIPPRHTTWPNGERAMAAAAAQKWSGGWRKEGRGGTQHHS